MGSFLNSRSSHLPAGRSGVEGPMEMTRREGSKGAAGGRGLDGSEHMARRPAGPAHDRRGEFCRGSSQECGWARRPWHRRRVRSENDAAPPFAIGSGSKKGGRVRTWMGRCPPAEPRPLHYVVNLQATVSLPRQATHRCGFGS
jgi:hypothetical protein